MKLNPGLIFASCYFWFELFFLSAIFFTISVFIWLLTFLFDPRRVILHRYSCFWSDVVWFMNPMWKARFTGREHYDRSTTYVIVSNHASGADILVLFKLYLHFKWVAKRELFFFPFIGWNMLLCRYILLERGRRGSVRHMMDEAILDIRQHNSVMIFPEGTRSPDGKLQPFKTGAFQIAIETGAPILPIAIKGTHHAVQKGGLLIHRNHDIVVSILEPVTPSDYPGISAKELAQRVHDRIGAALAD